MHLAHGGTLVLRNADTLEPAAQELLASFLEVQARGAGGFPDPRAILLARSDSPPGIGVRGLVSRLRAVVADVVHMPALAERPKDILPLAEAFLAGASSVPMRFSDDARANLLGFLAVIAVTILAPASAVAGVLLWFALRRLAGDRKVDASLPVQGQSPRGGGPVGSAPCGSRRRPRADQGLLDRERPGPSVALSLAHRVEKTAHPVSGDPRPDHLNGLRRPDRNR